MQIFVIIFIYLSTTEYFIESTHARTWLLYLFYLNSNSIILSGKSSLRHSGWFQYISIAMPDSGSEVHEVPGPG